MNSPELEKPCKDKTWRFKDKDGYYRIGRMYRSQRYQKLHRYIYARHYKLTLTPDQEVMHLCHNTSCFEITHLALGTHAENMNGNRIAKRGRGPSKVTEDEVREIRKLYKENKLTCKEIGTKFKINGETARYIATRRTYKWVR